MVVVLIAITILLYTGQTFFNKLFAGAYKGPAAAAAPVFAVVYGLITGIATFVYNGFTCMPGTTTFWMGIANGVMLFVYNYSMISAAQKGPYAFQSLMMLSGGIIVPLIFSTLYWKDQISAVKIVGILVMIAAFVIFNLKGLKFEGARKGYILWVILLFLSNGIYSILIDAQQRVMQSTERNEMIIITFMVSAVISAVYLAATQKKQTMKAFKMSGKALIFMLISSISAAAAINFLMVVLAYVNAPVLYSISDGSILIISSVLGVIVLKEKLSRNMIAGLFVAVVSIVLLSI